MQEDSQPTPETPAEPSQNTEPSGPVEPVRAAEAEQGPEPAAEAEPEPIRDTTPAPEPEPGPVAASAPEPPPAPAPVPAPAAPAAPPAAPSPPPAAYPTPGPFPPAAPYPPQPGYGPPPPGYQYPYQAAPPPAPRRPPLIVGADLLAIIRDALIPLLGVLILVFGAVVGMAYLITPTAHGGFSDWFASAVMLLAGALGAPSSLSVSGGVGGSSSDSGNGFSLDLSFTFEIDATLWIVAFALFFIWLRQARKRETVSPSISPTQVLARSALSALGVSLVLLVLALVAKTSHLFGLTDALFGSGSGSGDSGNGFSSGGGDLLGNGTGSTTSSNPIIGLGTTAPHSSVGVQPGWVFLGPLLIVLAACVIGRLAAIARRPAGDPGGEWIRKLVAPWRAAAVVAKTQLRAVAVLAGLIVLVYVVYHVLDGHDSGREKTAGVIAAVLLLPNLAVGGGFTGFGVTLFAGTSLAGVFSAAAQGQGTGRSAIGLFGDSRPWLIWLLIGAAVVGTLLPWLLVRTRRRVVDPAAFAPSQAWRATLIGLVAGFTVGMLGQITVTGEGGFSILGGGGLTIGLIYSLLGSLLAGAVWCTAAYLFVAMQVTPRQPKAPAVPAAPPMQYGWPGSTPGVTVGQPVYPQPPAPVQPYPQQQPYSQQPYPQQPYVQPQPPVQAPPAPPVAPAPPVQAPAVEPPHPPAEPS
jgi:hypothetical protein